MSSRARGISVRLSLLVTSVLALLVSGAVFALPVIPGAVGFGMETRAGREGTVFRVRSLADTGANTLRAALEATGPRVVIFEVSGTIELDSQIVIRNPFVTIAGQTAPSPGIVVTGAPVVIRTHDVLMQHIRIRPGVPPNSTLANTWDALGLIATGSEDAYNIVIDHVSLAWSADGLLDSFAASPDANEQQHILRDVTIRNSILAEPLRCPPAPPNCRHLDNDGKPEHHDLTSVLAKARNITIWRNVHVRGTARHPKMDEAAHFAIVNNVIYRPGPNPDGKILVEDPKKWPGDPNDRPTAVIEGNVVITRTDADDHTAINIRGTGELELYLKDNTVIVPSASGGETRYGAGDPWASPQAGGVLQTSGVTVTRKDTRPSAAFPAGLPVLTSGIEAAVLNAAGARPADRDSQGKRIDPQDERIIDDVVKRTGPDFVDTPPAGAPLIGPSVPPHMLPDNPNALAPSGYTNLEEWLHAKAAEVEGGSTAPAAALAVFDDFEDGEASGWTVDATHDWSVVVGPSSKAFKQNTVTGDARATLDATNNWNDQVVEADVTVDTFAGPDDWAGLFVRYTDIGNAYYITLRNSGSLQLRKIVGGQPTILASHSMVVTPGVKYRLRLEAIGSFLRVYLNDAGIPALSISDTSHTSGRVALGTNDAAAQFDNVLAAPAAIAQAKLLQDDFRDGDSAGWAESGTSPWTVTSANGTPVLRQTDITSLNGAAFTASYRRDQSVESDVNITGLGSGSSLWAGLLARFTDLNNTYFVKLQPNVTNGVSLRKVVGGVISDLAPPAEFSIAMNRTYRVRLEAVGYELKVYIDGVLVLQGSDAALAAGRAGVVTNKARADFDSVVMGLGAPAVMARDDFEDGNANGWTPGGTHAWTVASGVAADGTATQVYRQSDSTGNAYSVFTGSSRDQSVQARIRALSFNGSDRWVGLMARFVDFANHYYITVRAGPTNQIWLRRTVNGLVSPALAFAEFEINTTLWYKFRLDVFDSTLRVYIDTFDGAGWKLMIEHTDQEPLNAGNHFGVRMFMATAEYDEVVATTP